MNITALTTAFGAGMIATINPCGFAMLPAYISYFFISGDRVINTRDHLKNYDNKQDDRDNYIERFRRLFRAILTGAVTTSGFIIIFASIGTFISLGSMALQRLIPWIGILIGIILIFLGIWLLSGHHLVFPGGVSFKFRKKTNLVSFFLFGIGYSLASLTCTLPIFLAVIGSTFATAGVFQATLQFLSYVLGMGLIIIALTMSIAFSKGALVQRLRQIVPYVERISAVLLLGSGGYILYYWLMKSGYFFLIR